LKESKGLEETFYAYSNSDILNVLRKLRDEPVTVCLDGEQYFLHRHIMHDKLGRYLRRKSDYVRFINGDKTDVREENLELWSDYWKRVKLTRSTICPDSKSPYATRRGRYNDKQRYQCNVCSIRFVTTYITKKKIRSFSSSFETEADSLGPLRSHGKSCRHKGKQLRM
jgi:hypothetical protein